MKLWQKIVIGMVLGVIAGLVFEKSIIPYVDPLGILFIRMIKMLIVPLIFFSLISGVTSISDPAKMGRMGLKTVGAYLVTTVGAITIGLLVGYFIQAGVGINLNLEATREVNAAPSVAHTLVNIIPTNPIRAFTEGNILQIIAFAILFGIAMTHIGERGKKIIEINNTLAEITYKLAEIIMKFAPIGVFALIAKVVADYGIEMLLPMAKVIGGVYGACLLHMILIYGGFLVLLKLNPISFFIKVFEAQIIAFTTTSSSATLPVSMKIAQEELGVSKETSSFVLPLGATINMDGTAIYQGVCVLFIAQAMGITLTGQDYVTIILTSTLASIGTAGVPGAGLIMLALVLESVGLPIEGIAIIAGIDRILDMMRTAVNVTGDSLVTIFVDKTEGFFNKKMYDNPENID